MINWEIQKLGLSLSPQNENYHKIGTYRKKFKSKSSKRLELLEGKMIRRVIYKVQ